MRIRHLLLLTAILLVTGFPARASASPADSLYKHALAQYRTADYHGAMQSFQGLIDEGYESFDLYYNFGNAAYKNGDLGISVVFYERALRLDPGNEDVEHNLNVVRARLRDRVEPIPLLFFVQWWNDLKQAHRPAVFFVWSVVFLFVLAAAAFVFFGYSRVLLRRFALAAGILFLAFFILSLSLYVLRSDELAARQSAVVILTETAVRSAPDATGVESFIIHEGLKVEILDKKDGYYRIRLADGKTGWAELPALMRI
jgi:tetratricopeptide (TPR) repeat protein